MMSNRFAEMIQPEGLRSPEVIIGAEWDTKADIWNFGCLVSVLVPILKLCRRASISTSTPDVRICPGSEII